MTKHSKRFIQLRNTLTKPQYNLEEGLTLLQTFQTCKFVESAEAHISFNIRNKGLIQLLKGHMCFPFNIGKIPKIAIVGDTSFFQTLTFNNVLYLEIDTLVQDIQQGKVDFDILLTLPQYMPQLAKLGKILGPKGLMPSLKAGTVTTNLEKTIEEFQRGRIDFRADKAGSLHIKFGKLTFVKSELSSNFLTLIQTLEKIKPSGHKGKYIESIYLCTTMSPSIKLDLTSIKN